MRFNLLTLFGVTTLAAVYLANAGAVVNCAHDTLYLTVATMYLSFLLGSAITYAMMRGDRLIRFLNAWKYNLGLWVLVQYVALWVRGD